MGTATRSVNPRALLAGSDMNMAPPFSTADADDGLSPSQRLLQSAVVGLDAFARDLEPIKNAVRSAAQLGDQNSAKIAAQLEAKLEAFEPSVTMIGQIKSGKTSLVNCMIGSPDLLPTDVNPWTSVVTSLHMSPTPVSPETRAKFCFFDENEWDRLIAGGGRIGELADRAGADEELAKIKAQVEQMREKSKMRLGDRFELLLGQQHDYGYFDHELVEKYVCLGDDFDDSASEQQGRFADITRSADLFFHQPALPIRLCIRDTPGVNDTFMMREQITIRSIRDSRICVVVLSAHQALSSTDLALVRLISNVKSNEVIIFVNRIDELSEPSTQLLQIRESIMDTLSKTDGPKDAEIIFGSAIWAQGAMLGSFSRVPEASKAALMQLATQSEDTRLQHQTTRSVLWELSGIPALFAAISSRIVEGEGQDLRKQVATRARNLLTGIKQADNLKAKAQVGETPIQLNPTEITAAISDIQRNAHSTFKAELAELRDAFSTRLCRVHDSFLSRATQALLLHLERYGEDDLWEYDPAGLRLLLRSSYQAFGKSTQSAFDRCINQAAEEITSLYQRALDLPSELFDIRTPPQLRVPPPVTLGQTIALDLKGTWWRNWWYKRRGYQSYTADFQKLIHAETIGIIDDLKGQHGDALHEFATQEAERFVNEQVEILVNTLSAPLLSEDGLDVLFDRQALVARDAELQRAAQNLEAAEI